MKFNCGFQYNIIKTFCSLNSNTQYNTSPYINRGRQCSYNCAGLPILRPEALGLRVYISGKPLVPMV